MYSKKIVLNIPSQLVDKPLIYRLSKDFKLEFNILKALVNPKEEGLMVLELKGQKAEYERALKYLQKEKVKVQTLSRDVSRNEEKCVHCGACVTICPAQAFSFDRQSRKVLFDQDKCIACGICIKNCPYAALKMEL